MSAVKRSMTSYTAQKAAHCSYTGVYGDPLSTVEKGSKENHVICVAFHINGAFTIALRLSVIAQTSVIGKVI